VTDLVRQSQLVQFVPATAGVVLYQYWQKFKVRCVNLYLLCGIKYKYGSVNGSNKDNVVEKHNINFILNNAT
jgi:hypothetical protein